MRLKQYEVDTIKTNFINTFQEGEVFLFGSRTNDSKRGGDIDLFLEVVNRTDLFEKKIKFLAKLKRALGDQKIDIVFNEDPNRLIEQEARKCAIRL